MKGKLYKYDPESGQMIQIGHGELTFELPTLKSAKDAVIENAKAMMHAELVLSGTIDSLDGLTPKDLLKKAFDMADEQAESMDRRKCVERQEMIDQMRQHFLNE